MSSFGTFCFALILLEFMPIEVAPRKAREYEIQNEWLNYHQAWESCKQQGLQLATVQTIAENTNLAGILNRPEFKGEWFWSTNKDIDRTIQWKYITFNDGQMTLIAEDGKTITTRCILVKDYPPSGTNWSDDLCTQVHRYICDKI